MPDLHIFNGDSLAEALSEKLDGTHMVWREALCQGPISYKIGEMGSLDRREQFFVSQYGEEAKESYREFRHVISWLVDREYLSQFEEVILWFGQDYFCQFNMLALLSLWQQEGLALKNISLVSTQYHPELGHVTCLGNLTPEQLLGIYPERKRIESQDLQVADILWKLLTSEDPLPFNHFGETVPHDPFNWAKTIRLHCLLFPSLQSGVNVLERRALMELEEGPMELKKLIGNLLRKDQNYGLGDSQYVAMVQHLSPMLIQHEGMGWDTQWELTEEGRGVLEGSISFKRGVFFKRGELPAGQVGGASDGKYAWDEGAGKLVELGD